jgi:hypothetical protein
MDGRVKPGHDEVVDTRVKPVDDGLPQMLPEKL